MTDRSVVYRLRADITSFRTQMAQASASTKKLATDLTALDKNGAQMRAGLTTLGGAAGKVGLVAAAGLGAAVLASANFDQSMSKVLAATGESADAMEQLRAAALKAGADTVFSATEAADGMTALAKAGVSTQDILGGGLTGALDLAAAGELDVAQAAEIAATTMTQFGLAGADVGHIADVLAAAAGKAQGEVTDMAGALKYVGPVAAQMGISLEETGGSIAYLASQGILGEQAGTSLRGMLTSLTSPSNIARKTMDDLGISLYDAQGAFIGFDGLAGQLQATMGGLTEAERNEALGRIFGNEQITAARVLYAGGADAIADWTAKVDDSGFAAEQAATKLDNLKGDLEALKGSLETALIGAGDGAQSPLRSLTQNLTGAVNAFNDLSPAAKGAVSSMLGITAILGGGLWFTSKVVGGIASASRALDQLGISTKTATTGLTRVTRSTSTLLALGSAVTILGNELAEATGSKMNLSDLQRDLEAIANGRNAEMLKQFSDDLFTVGQRSGKIVEPLKEAVTAFGLFGNTPMDNSRDNIEAIDQALASMVESGDGAQAAAIFEQLQAQAEASGVSVADLAENLDGYNQALVNAGEAGVITSDGLVITSRMVESTGLAALRTAHETQDLGQAMDQAGHKGQRMAARMEAQAKALEESRKQAHEGAEQFVGLGDSLDKAKVSLGGWLRQLEKQAEALRNFRVNAQKAAKKGLDDGLIKSLNAAGPAGALRMKQLANATDAEIGRANKAWRSMQREVERTTDVIGGVPRNVHIDVTANTSSAMSKLYELNRIKLDDKTIYIHTQRVGSDSDFVSGGQRKAMGGLLTGPGTATSDSIPVLASNGEYMVRASAVQHYGVGFFDALNAQRFAAGGLVGASPIPAAPSVSVGGAQVRVFIDGNEVRAIVAEESSADRRFTSGHVRGYDRG